MIKVSGKRAKKLRRQIQRRANEAKAQREIQKQLPVLAEKPSCKRRLIRFRWVIVAISLLSPFVYVLNIGGNVASILSYLHPIHNQPDNRLKPIGPTFRERIERIIHPISGTKIDTLALQLHRLEFETVYSEAGEVKQPNVFFGGIPLSSFFQLSIENGEYYVDVNVQGLSISKTSFNPDVDYPPDFTNETRVWIKHNGWDKFPQGWQVNSNNIALEIVNKDLQPVFQLIKRSPSHIVVYGILSVDDVVLFISETAFLVYYRSTKNYGTKFLMADSLLTNHRIKPTRKSYGPTFMFTGYLLDIHRIKPKIFFIQRIFQYPTEGHEGQVEPEAIDKISNRPLGSFRDDPRAPQWFFRAGSVSSIY